MKRHYNYNQEKTRCRRGKMNTRGYYKEYIQIRIPRKIKTMVVKNARKKRMTVSEYIRSLIYRDLGVEELYYGDTSDR
jgi:hypothetical protein